MRSSGDTSGGGSGESPAAFLDNNNKMTTNFMSSSTPYYNQLDHLHKHHQDFTEIGVYGNQTSINNQFPSGISLEPSFSRGTTGKVLFTATQWQELERQTMIYKYIMASIPVPPQLLISLSTQSNKMGMDLRFSTGSDPEPWRCRRTDGKKWRCSRDVAPDQKYCERHAHKSRPRSRKPVEIQPNNINIITTSAHNLTPTPNNTTAATSAYQHQHPRCTEWLVKSGTIPVSSSSNQQIQQSMNTTNSPRVGSKRTHIFPQDFEGNHPHESNLSYSNNIQLDSAGARRQNFIDAWSKSGVGDDCSLTLSMQCSGGIDDIDQSFEIGSLRSHNQWLNQGGSWMGNSPPGGPLGEALGLGVHASNMKAPENLLSSHGQSSSNTTTSSSCEKGAHKLSFIR